MHRRAVAGAGGLLTAAAVGAAVLAATAGSAAAASPQALVRSGMAKFQKNDVAGALADFDAAYAADEALRPYLWQRGLALYYAGDYAGASRQFRGDVAVNPNDTEEAIWAYLSEVRGGASPAQARERFLKVGRDPRPVLRAAYEAFRSGEGAPGGILAAASADRQGQAAFYSQLYAGLWHESEGDEAAARLMMASAAATEYARRSGDYMTDLARVHVRQRGWGD